jgi:tetratricopeptide (TPR) repeat protein
MALAAVERNALLEDAWTHVAKRDYVAVLALLEDLPLQEHLREPELGILLCHAFYQLGEFERSLQLNQQLIEACERRGNTSLSRRRANSEGLLRLMRGELDIAEPILQQVLIHAEEASDVRMTAWVHNNLGILHTARGTWDFALSHFRRAVAACHRVGDMRHLSLCKLNMGVAYLRMGYLQEAREHLTSAMHFSRELGSASELAHIEYSLACVFEKEEDFPLARATANQAWVRFSDLNNKKGQGAVLHLYGRIFTKTEKATDARLHLENALTLIRKSGFKEEEGFLMESMADLSFAEGSVSDGISYLYEAVKIFTAINSPFQVERLYARIPDMKRQHLLDP